MNEKPVSLVWITPNAEKLIASMARVSNPKNQDNENIEGLLNYCIKNQHWSIFEMVNCCVEINTTRDISRQILRHRSFSFQEFSQRYAEVEDKFSIRECRLQDITNRQKSNSTDNVELKSWWTNVQLNLLAQIREYYNIALEMGIAKEQARVILPEGLTPTRMYMNGTLRSWIHYCQLRTDNGTQAEHQRVATQISELLGMYFPVTWKALESLK